MPPAKHPAANIPHGTLDAKDHGTTDISNPSGAKWVWGDGPAWRANRAGHARRSRAPPNVAALFPRAKADRMAAGELLALYPDPHVLDAIAFKNAHAQENMPSFDRSIFELAEFMNDHAILTKAHADGRPIGLPIRSCATGSGGGSASAPSRLCATCASDHATMHASGHVMGHVKALSHRLRSWATADGAPMCWKQVQPMSPPAR